LLALAEVESVQVTGSGHGAGPIPALRPGWVRAAGQGSANSAELRLALAFALQRWRQGKAYASKSLPDVRRHWLPLKGARYDVNSDKRLQLGPGLVMSGRKGEDDAIAVVGRRLIEASQQGEHRLPLAADRHASACAADLAAVLEGQVDLDRTLALARALMALNGPQWQLAPEPLTEPKGHDSPDDAWVAIRLALLPWPLDKREIGADPAIVRRLATGDTAGAVMLTLRRLRAKGIGCTVRAASTDSPTARRWAAALAFPISPKAALAFLKRIDPSDTNREFRS